MQYSPRSSLVSNRPDKGAVDERAQQMAVIEPPLGGRHHRDDDELFDRVDPERGAEDAAPEIFADRTRQRTAPGGGAHRKAEAEAVAHLRHGCERPEPRTRGVSIGTIG